ncbi:MFS transporter [Clostridium sp. UBA1056]|uniref:MFS transporter n=1 Tax=unclassified Clostridium TaxID=2614128 RepID=UPI0032166062
MGKRIEKLGFSEKTARNFIAILLVASGGAIIYGLPYFRYDYYDAYLQAYNLTNTQMGVFGSIFGFFGMVSYLFGGYLADRFSIRKLLTVSLIGTGLGGFLHLLPLSFGALVCLYAFWGFTSLFAFWPACVKAVRILSSPEDQGKAFGWFEGGRGVAAAVMAPLAVIVFQLGAKRLDDATGMRYVIIFYSIITIMSGLLVFWKMKDENIGESEKLSFRGIKNVLRLPAVWIIGMVTFCNYVFTLSLYYFTPYATGILGMTVTLGATLAAVKRFISPISNVGGGYIADKVGTGNLLLVSFLAMAAGTLAILFLPLSASSTIVFIILYLVIYFFYNVNYALTWAMMGEGNIPEQYSGTAAGIIATVGYLPEIFCSLLAGILIDGYPGVTGFRYYFGFLIVMLLIGAGFVLVWKKYLKKQKQ